MAIKSLLVTGNRLLITIISILLLVSISSADTVTVDSANNVGQYTSIDTVGSNVFVAYYDVTNGDLRFSNSSDGATWTNVAVDTANNVGQYAAVDAFNATHIYITYYLVTGGGDLKFANSSDGGATWSNRTIAAQGDVGGWNGLEVVNSSIFNSYFDASMTNLSFSNSSDGGVSWTNISIDGSGTIMGRGSSLDAINSTHIFISYLDDTNSDLRFANSSDGGALWSTQTVDGTGGVIIGITPTSLEALDVSNLYISYWDDSNDVVKFANSSNGGVTWSTQIVTSATNAFGQWNSLSSVNRTHHFISFYANTTSDLRVVNTSDGGITWTMKDIDVVGNVGEYTSIKMLSDLSNGYISYYDNTNGDLKVIDGFLNAWTVRNCTSLRSGINMFVENVQTNNSCFTFAGSDVNVTCQGFGITGNQTNSTVFFTGFNATNVNNITISRCSIFNLTYGIFFMNVVNATIKDNNITENAQFGIYAVNGSHTLWIYNNSIASKNSSNIGGQGILIANASRSVNITGNSINLTNISVSSSFAIGLMDAVNDSLIENNTVFVNGSLTALRILRLSRNIDRITIRNNDFYGVGSAQHDGIIAVTNITNIAIVNNTISTGGEMLNIGATSDGINSGINITDNIFQSGGGSTSNLIVIDNWRNLTIFNNSMFDIVSRIVRIRSSNSSSSNFGNITRNTINSSYTSALIIETGANNIVVDNNVIYASGSSSTLEGAIALTGTNNDVNITRNIVNVSLGTNPTQGSAIRLRGTGATSIVNRTIVRDNVIYVANNFTDGIAIEESVRNTNVTGNNITTRGSSSRGIRAGGSVGGDPTTNTTLVFANSVSTIGANSSGMIVMNAFALNFTRNIFNVSNSNSTYILSNVSNVLLSGNVFNRSIDSDVVIVGANYTFLIDQPVTGYEFVNASHVVIGNSSTGNVTFTYGNITVKGTNLSDDVYVVSGRAFVNSTLRSGWNVSANITLISVNHSAPRMYRAGDNGVFSECSASTTPACTNISYSGLVYIFNITSWTSYNVSNLSVVAGGFNVTLLRPINQSNFSITSIDMNYSVVGANSTYNCSLLLNGTINRSRSTNNDTVSNFTLRLGAGFYPWNVNCSDGTNTNSSVVGNFTFNVSYSGFNITLARPLNLSRLTPGFSDLNYTVVGGNTTYNCTLLVNGTMNFNGTNSNNISVQTSNNTLTNISLNWSRGSYVWNMNCTDGVNNNVSALGNFSFVVADSGFNVTLVRPTNGSTATDGDTLDFNYTVIGSNSTYNCSILFNSTINASQSTSNNTMSNFSLAFGVVTHQWNVNCSDGGNTNSSAVGNFTITYNAAGGNPGVSPTGQGAQGGGGGGGSTDKKTALAIFNLSLSRLVYCFPGFGCEKKLEYNAVECGSTNPDIDCVIENGKPVVKYGAENVIVSEVSVVAVKLKDGKVLSLPFEFTGISMGVTAAIITGVIVFGSLFFFNVRKLRKLLERGGVINIKSGRGIL